MQPPGSFQAEGRTKGADDDLVSQPPCSLGVRVCPHACGSAQPWPQSAPGAPAGSTARRPPRPAKVLPCAPGRPSGSAGMRDFAQHAVQPGRSAKSVFRVEAEEFDRTASQDNKDRATAGRRTPAPTTFLRDSGRASRNKPLVVDRRVGGCRLTADGQKKAATRPQTTTSKSGRSPSAASSASIRVHR